MLKKGVKILFLLILYLVLPVLLTAQPVRVQRSLNFDRTQSGTSIMVHPNSARFAGFLSSGPPGSEGQITFEFSSGNSLPVSFDPDAAGYNKTDNLCSLLLFGPDDMLMTNLSTVGSLYIWSGGAIYPDQTQRRGSYCTDITLTASYTTE